MQVSNGNGCTRTGSYTVNVINSLVAFIGDSTVCSNTNLNLSASGGTSYLWNTGATSNSISVSPSQYTLYTVTVTNSNICSATHSFPVYINSTPTASISGDFYACENESTIITASIGNSYLWSTGDTTRSITIPSNTPTGPYSVTVTSNNGCSASTAAIHNFVPPPAINVTGTESKCGPGTFYLNAYTAGSSYLWSIGNTSSAISVNANTTTNIGLTITNSYGCTNDTIINLVINTLPQPIISTLDSNLCNGESTVLNCNLSNVTYSWSNADTTSSISITQAGNYQLICTDNNGCTGMSNTVQINNVSSPAPILSSPGDTICYGDSITVLATGASQYLWSPSVNIIDANSSSPVFYPTANTIYTLTGTNNYGCTANTNFTIQVNPLPIVNAGLDQSINSGTSLQLGGNPTAVGLGPFIYQWTPGTQMNDSLTSNPILFPDSSNQYIITVVDGNGCINRDTISIIVNTTQGVSNENLESTIYLFPNPVQHLLHLQIQSKINENVDYKIISITGQELFGKKGIVVADRFEEDINTEDWPSGLYFLIISSKSTNQSLRFMKID